MTTKQIEMQTAVIRVLTTPLGSRVMRPQFGSRLFELIDRTLNDDYRIDALHYTYEAVETNLPEIEIRSVTVESGVLKMRIANNNQEEEVHVNFAA